MEHTVFTASYRENAEAMRRVLRLSSNFDLKERTFRIAGRPASLYFVDVFTKDDIMERLLERLMQLTPEELQAHSDARSLAETYIP